MSSTPPWFVTVDFGEGAVGQAPVGELEWQLRYGRPEPVRMVAASVVATFNHLVLECSKAEAWRRIKLLRAALEAENSPLEKPDPTP